jgi:hypothetical protein
LFGGFSFSSVIDEQNNGILPLTVAVQKQETTSYTASMSGDSRWILATRKDQGEEMNRGERKSTSSEGLGVFFFQYPLLAIGVETLSGFSSCPLRNDGDVHSPASI